MLKHRIQYGKQQLAHTSGKCQLFGLTCGTEPLIKDTDNRIIGHSDQGSHVKYRPNSRSPSPHGAFASHHAAVTSKRGYSSQSYYLPPIERARFLQLSENTCRKGLPYPRSALQQFVFFSPDRACVNISLQIPINIIQSSPEPLDIGLHIMPDSGLAGGSAPVFLSRDHLHDLTPPRHNLFQVLGIQEGMRVRTHSLSTMGDHLGTNSISFGQFVCSLCEVPNLTRINRRRVHASFGQSSPKRKLKTSRGLENHHGWVSPDNFSGSFENLGETTFAALRSSRPRGHRSISHLNHITTFTRYKRDRGIGLDNFR